MLPASITGDETERRRRLIRLNRRVFHINLRLVQKYQQIPVGISEASFLAHDPNRISCPPLGRTSFAIRLISFNMSSDVIILWLYDCQNGNIHACKANKYFIRKRGAYTKKAPASDCKCLIFFWSSGSQDVSVATPWLLLILTYFVVYAKVDQSKG